MRFRTNCACSKEPVVWIPNAILIGGVNNTFQPVVSFADFANYRMEIHNRWGDVLFSTEDFATGWDGTYKDQFVPEGTYGYFNH